MTPVTPAWPARCTDRGARGRTPSGRAGQVRRSRRVRGRLSNLPSPALLVSGPPQPPPRRRRGSARGDVAAVGGVRAASQRRDIPGGLALHGRPEPAHELVPAQGGRRDPDRRASGLVAGAARPERPRSRLRPGRRPNAGWSVRWRVCRFATAKCSCSWPSRNSRRPTPPRCWGCARRLYASVCSALGSGFHGDGRRGWIRTGRQ